MRVRRLCTLIAFAAALLLNTGCVFHRHGCRCGLFHRHRQESSCGPACCGHVPDCGCSCGAGGVPLGPPPMAPPTFSPLPPPTPMIPAR